MRKLRVIILRGGPSEEYSISLMTGNEVLNAVKSNTDFEPIDVIITKTGEWLVEGVVRYPEHIVRVADVVFIALHGAYGEDGTVQRFLDQYSVPYTGSGAYASRIAMHKGYTKEHLRGLLEELPELKFPEHVIVSRDSLDSLSKIVSQITNLFGPEYVVKPVTSGSSFGISMVDSALELQTAIAATLQQYPEVIVERRIRGREAACAVMERFRNEDVYALPPVEIIPPSTSQFFDSVCKYDGSTKEICPSSFSQKTKKTIENSSKLIHQKLNLSQFSRSDFIVTKDGIYFLEVNTLPGLTPESLFPKAIKAVGSNYNELVTHLINDAYTRNKKVKKSVVIS